MKKTLLLAGMLAMCVTSAFAGPAGVDISFNACPGDAGSTQQGTIDCAGGGILTALVTFAPAEAITDLVALDTIVDFFVQSGDINSTASFWDFETANVAGASLAHLRPSSGCSTPVVFANTWNQSGAGTGLGALVTSPHSVRLAAGTYRASNFNATAGQDLFGYPLSINGATSVEAGGSASGCAYNVNVIVHQAIPQSAAGNSTTTLVGPSNNPTSLSTINAGFVSARRRTWAELKSLYR